MRITSFLMAVLCAGLFVITNKTGFGYDDGDFQFWMAESISGEVNTNWKMTLTNEERFGDDANEHYQHNTDIGFSKTIDKTWGLGLHFKYVTKKKSSGWQYEHRYYVNTSHKFLIKNLKAANKFQVEFRHKENNDFYRFRNKLTINLPKIRESLTPYIADEVFTDTEAEKLNRNRFYLGIKNNLIDNTYGSVFYLWQRDKKPTYWKDTYILGVKISFKL